MNSLGLIQLICWLGVAGLAIYAFGLFGLLTPLIALSITLLVISKIAFIIRLNHTDTPSYNSGEKTLFVMLLFQLLLHSLGALVPETAFDALWYHLPEAQVYGATGQIAKIPDLLYSTMPRLGEMYLTLAMFSQSAVVVKVMSFIICILYLITGFFVARLFLSRTHSLLVVVILASFPLIGWQSTTAYVDLTRALFELASLYCLLIVAKTIPRSQDKAISKWMIYSAILTGFALSTKLHSFTHLLTVLLLLAILLIKHTTLKKSLFFVSCFLVIVSVTASPWYLDNHLNSGHAFYPLNLHEKRLDQVNHAGVNSLSEWASHQLLRLPLMPINLSHPRQQLSPIILLLFPILLWQLPQLFKNPMTRLLLGYCLLVTISWWFLPPPESRYLLGTLPLLVILLIKALATLPKNYETIRQIAILGIMLSVFITTTIRIAASTKYIPLLTDHITREEFIHSQTTPFNRDIIEKYHSGHWQNYRY
jgi:hypothetical protein